MSAQKCDEAIEYITSLKGGSINPGLSRIKDLLNVMGNPQEALKFIHIAGTNGKGSTLTFVSGILIEAGYRVGTYTSPAVFDYRERYRVGRRNISAEDLVKGVMAVRAAASKMEEMGLDTPSSFEAETALAFWYFKEKACDFVVLETGMGGAEDATNIIDSPLAAVITSIGYDHMAFLGDSLEKIASQKAGIIKKGCTVLSGQLPKEAEAVIENKAKECGCEYKKANLELIKDRKVSKASFMQLFDYGDLKKISIRLSGKYQLRNAALAIEVINALRGRGIKISDRAVYSGFEKAVWPGRFQKIADSPLVIIDGAHNEEAAGELAKSIDFYFTNRHIVYIMGMLKDKEYDKVCELLAQKAFAIFTVSTKGPRALMATELAETVKRINTNVTAADSPAEALELARMVAGKEGVVIVFGSLSFLRNITEFADNGSGKDKKGR